MINLYTWGTPNGRKVSIALEEMGLPYQSVAIDISNGAQFAPDFLKISPNNKIPALTDGDQSLFESGAILLYLAQKSGQFAPKQDSPEYWDMMQWLMWQMGGFGPILGQAHHFLKFNPGKSPYAEDRYFTEAQRLYGVLDRHLAQSPYMISSLSIADFAVWPWVSRYEFQRIDLNDYPNVLRWYLELADRSGFQRGYAQPKDLGDIPRPAANTDN